MEEFLEFAVREALKSPVYTQVGAVLWSSTGLVLAGHNIPTPPWEPRFPFLREMKWTTHAETSVILRAISRGWDFRVGEWNILVVSPRKDGSFRNSFPCPHCLRLIQAVGIKRLYYWEEGKLKVLLL